MRNPEADSGHDCDTHHHADGRIKPIEPICRVGIGRDRVHHQAVQHQATHFARGRITEGAWRLVATSSFKAVSCTAKRSVAPAPNSWILMFGISLELGAWS